MELSLGIDGLSSSSAGRDLEIARSANYLCCTVLRRRKRSFYRNTLEVLLTFHQPQYINPEHFGVADLYYQWKKQRCRKIEAQIQKDFGVIRSMLTDALE